MKRPAFLVAAFAAAVLLASCSGHGAGSGLTPPADVPSQVPAFTPYTGPAQLADFQWGQRELQGASVIGSLAGGVMNVNVAIRPQNAPGLLAYAQDASNPASPFYRHFLTPQQIGDRFGASEQDYADTAAYFAGYGLSVAGWPQRLLLAVSGPQSALEKAFGTSFAVYEKNGERFIAPAQTPHFSRSLPVVAVANLVTLPQAHSYLIVAPPRAGENQTIGYSPQVVQAAFDFTGAYAKGFTGAGIDVGIIGTGPIEQQDLPALANLYHDSHVAPIAVATVSPQGITAGLQQAGIPTATPAPAGTPAPNPSFLPASGSFASPPPATATCDNTTKPLPGCNPEDGEAQLDTQQVATLAYGSSVSFYLAYNTNDCGKVSFPNPCPTSGSNAGTPQIGLSEADPEIEQAIGDDKADVISISYGNGETQQYGARPGQYQTLEFAALAAEGVAVFVSSGDNGSANCYSGSTYLGQQCASYPATDPNVTAVGGVTLPVDPYGRLTAPIIAWGTTTTLGTEGSGGGVSQLFAAPAWQKNDLGATMREVPDVSMDGDPQTGVAVFSQAAFPNSVAIPSASLPGYGPLQYGGTSVSAPEMAAMWALVLDACRTSATCNKGGAVGYRLGNAAPLLYGIYAQKSAGGAAPAALPYGQVFYDVAYGSNEMQNPSPKGGAPVPGELAGAGYDEVTGLGVPFAGHLIQAVTGISVP